MVVSIKIAIVYLVAINVVTFVVYGIDKWKAIHDRWRIPEATLLILATVGGSIGALLGMYVWHHKTKHKKFRYGVPLILVAQIILILLSSCGSRRLVEEPLTASENDSMLEKPRSPQNDDTVAVNGMRWKGRGASGRVPVRERDSLSRGRFEPDYSPNVFLVSYDATEGKEALLRAVKEYGCGEDSVEVVYDYKFTHAMALKKPACKTLEETMRHFRSIEGVISVDYDRIIRLDDPVRPRHERY